ncbi:hypothetical protein GCM10023339_06030 [Alloalcanivorax gelatiniphagus]
MNDFLTMLLAIVASLGGLAGLLVVMTFLEPAKPGVTDPRRVVPLASDPQGTSVGRQG